MAFPSEACGPDSNGLGAFLLVQWAVAKRRAPSSGALTKWKSACQEFRFMTSGWNQLLLTGSVLDFLLQ